MSIDDGKLSKQETLTNDFHEKLREYRKAQALLETAGENLRSHFRAIGLNADEATAVLKVITNGFVVKITSL